MNARILAATIISAAGGGITALALTGSALWAQKPGTAPTPSANSTCGLAANQHQQQQQMMGQMQQRTEQCAPVTGQGMMGSGNADARGQQGQHGQGSANHRTSL